ncbi:MAG TPA: ribonuclease PH, partial [Gemmata sp.]|nr:ribonuclease PH [Gemmata sp.]
MSRPDNRKHSQLRPLSFKRKYTRNAPGAVLVKMGRTSVLCTCSVEPRVPEWMMGRGKGWMTAEYGMLPGSTHTRKARDKGGKVDGRSVEIQRLIGRSLRAVVDLEKLGERTLWIDCDVLEADGGTRTASINGAFVAVVDALNAIKKDLPSTIDAILIDSVAAVSVGI